MKIIKTGIVRDHGRARRVFHAVLRYDNHGDDGPLAVSTRRTIMKTRRRRGIFVQVRIGLFRVDKHGIDLLERSWASRFSSTESRRTRVVRWAVVVAITFHLVASISCRWLRLIRMPLVLW